MLSVPQGRVPVITPFLGGGFGCNGFVWPHTYLIAAIARLVRRPLKLVLTRAEMYSSCAHRPETINHLRLGAARDGRLTAIVHHGITHASQRPGCVRDRWVSGSATPPFHPPDLLGIDDGRHGGHPGAPRRPRGPGQG